MNYFNLNFAVVFTVFTALGDAAPALLWYCKKTQFYGFFSEKQCLEDLRQGKGILMITFHYLADVT